MRNIIFLLLLNLSFLFAIDNDNDLVQDEVDSCLNTPAGVFVDMQGCTKKLHRVVNFSYGSSVIDIEQLERLKEYAQLASEAFGYTIILKGHTDSTADYYTNLILSKKRAYAVLKQLENNGIDKKRIVVKWYGESLPIATNVTLQGRATNRRVEITFQ